MHRFIAAATALVLIAAACADGSKDLAAEPSGSAETGRPGSVAMSKPTPAERPAILPVLANSELSRGPNRFLFSLTDGSGSLIAAPDVGVRLAFYEEGQHPVDPSFDAHARFIWTIEDQRGLYVADADFPAAGRWEARLEATFPDGTSQSVRVRFDVLEQSWTPALGAPAPAVATPTLADVDGDLSRLSTDRQPMERLYETSAADALEAGDPFVLVFATPAFCQSATCGPMLEMVKRMAEDHPELTFINVEPYVMEYSEGSLRPVLTAQGSLQPAPWTDAWGLLTEPYVVVVDSDGRVHAKLEVAFAPGELAVALEGL